jgi:tetratricopeptide (TPR) repeat protein
VLTARPGIVGVVTLVSFIDENSRVLPQGGGRVFAPQEFEARLLAGGFFPPNAAVVSADAVHRAGLFDEALTSLEDWDLWLRIAQNGERMASIAEPLAMYRVSSGSMSTNAARMAANRIAVLKKRFGPLAAESDESAEEKLRAYALGYRAGAFGFLQQQDVEAAWEWLSEAAGLWPRILRDVDTYYEWAFGADPRGRRGDARRVDFDAVSADVKAHLTALFSSVDKVRHCIRPQQAYSKLYLALGMLADQAGRWTLTRNYLLRAIGNEPLLLFDRTILRRLVKTSLSPRQVMRLKRALGRG